MMAQLILHQLFKIFNMKLNFIIISMFVGVFSNAQVILPQAFFANSNNYSTNISANTSFDIESATSGLTVNTYPAIKSEFSWTFNNTSAYSIQFWVTKLSQNNTARGFIGFTTAADGLSYSAGSFLFYEHNGSMLRNYVKNDYANDNIPLASFALGKAYQITTTYDGTNWRNYVNGVLKTTVRNTSTWNVTANLMLGNIGGYTNIKIDEVRFWDKALTTADVASTWNKPLTGIETGLKLYYNFNDQAYANENNTYVKFIKDITANNNKGLFSNLSLSGSQQNFTTDIAQVNSSESSILTVDPNIRDCYPGNDHGTDYGNTNVKSAAVLHDLYTPTNLIFYNNLSYNANQLSSPLLTLDAGRSILINNIYGKTTTASGITGNDPRTFEAWVKLNSLNNISIVSIGANTNNNLFEMAVDNGKLLLNIGPNFSSLLNLKSNGTLQINTWYQLVIVSDPWSTQNQATNYYNIYINGVLDNNFKTQINANPISTNINPYALPGDNSNILNTTNTNIYIGNSLRPFNGKLGSLKIYKRVLSETEILNRFNVTKSRFGY